MPKKLDKNLLKSKRWIIDGANGSEIQRLGEEECTGDFGAMSTLTQANIVEKVHRLYVEAGANFIIANTYSSNYNILSSYNQEEKCKGLIEESIALTNKAVAGVEDRYVAASISEHPPFDDNLKLCWPEEKQEMQNWEKTLAHLFDQNIDCLFLELIRTKEHGVMLAKAVNTVWKKLPNHKKVPIFVGLVPEFVDADKKNLRFMKPHYEHKNESYEDFTFSAENIKCYFDALSDVDLLGINIMHCDFDVVAPAVKILRECWDGPVGVYPQNGYWDYPEWIALEVDFEAAKLQLEEWLELDVNMFGGCCGTTPTLIKFLAKELKGKL